MKGDCIICKVPDVEVFYLQLYTIGSEGTEVCLPCRIALTNVAKGMMEIGQRAYMLGYKQGAKK